MKYEIFEIEKDCYEVHDLGIETHDTDMVSKTWIATTKTWYLANFLVGKLEKGEIICQRE